MLFWVEYWCALQGRWRETAMIEDSASKLAKMLVELGFTSFTIAELVLA